MLRKEVYWLTARRHKLYSRLLPEQSASLWTYYEQKLTGFYRTLDLIWNFDYYIVDTIRRTALFLIFALELKPGIFITFACRSAYPEIALFRTTFI